MGQLAVSSIADISGEESDDNLALCDEMFDQLANSGEHDAGLFWKTGFEEFEVDIAKIIPPLRGDFESVIAKEIFSDGSLGAARIGNAVSGGGDAERFPKGTFHRAFSGPGRVDESSVDIKQANVHGEGSGKF